MAAMLIIKLLNGWAREEGKFKKRSAKQSEEKKNPG
jgi:hypothetical protein